MNTTVSTTTSTKRKVGFWLGLGIFLLPIVFAWFLLRDGHTKRARIIGFAWLALVALGALTPRDEHRAGATATYGTSNTPASSGESDTRVMPEYPPAQIQFHALNKACGDAYKAGQNEIQKSLAFNHCNQQRSQFAAQQSISNWTGIISDISTDQGADVVTVDIESDAGDFEMKYMTVNNRFSDMNTNSMITPDNPLFDVLAQMKEGDKVNFDAEFLQHPEGKRGLWEGSLTEEGSMTEPEFNVRFTGIRPFGIQPSAAAAQTAGQRGANATMPSTGPEPRQPTQNQSQSCNNPGDYLSARGDIELAIAQFELDCPGHDLPTQWRTASRGDASVSVQSGNDQIVLPRFEGDQRRFATYRTRILEGARAGTNFSDHDAIVEIGCGAGCRFAYLVDLGNGMVHDVPLGGEKNYQLVLSYRPGSPVLDGVWASPEDFDKCVSQSFKWTGSGFVSLSEPSAPGECPQE